MATRKSTPKHLELDDATLQRAAAPITDRVNVEPAILNGMTASEAKTIGLVALVSCFLLGAFLVAVTGFWQALLLVTLLGPLVILWFSSKYLAGIKRYRPDGYYSQAIHLWLAGRGLTACKFISHDGYWSLGRTLPFSLGSAFPVVAQEKPIAKPSNQLAAAAATAPAAVVADLPPVASQPTAPVIGPATGSPSHRRSGTGQRQVPAHAKASYA